MHAHHTSYGSPTAEDSPCGCGGQCSGSSYQGSPETTGEVMAAERILATSPIEWSRAEVTVTFHANESGVVDLSRLLISVTALEATKEDRARVLDEQARVTSILVFNAHHKVRGLGYVEAPAGVFSPQRRQRSIDLGTLRLESGDTLAVTITVGEGGSRAFPALLTSAVPFRPDTERRDSCRGSQLVEPHVYLASPTHRVASGTTGLLTLSFEEDGIVDLATLQFFGVAWGGYRTRRDALPSTLVESIRLPNGEDMVLGNQVYDDTKISDAVAAPASMFSHLELAGSWVQSDCLRVQRGQQITLRLRHAGPSGHSAPPSEGPHATFSAGVRFYPATPPGSGEQIRPSEFFDQYQNL